MAIALQVPPRIPLEGRHVVFKDTQLGYPLSPTGVPI
jgi:hypothetical protein